MAKFLEDPFLTPKVSEYESQLLSPKWQYVRGRILERDHFRCTKCRSDRNLQVHHKYYIHGRKAWEYSDDALITLCDKCHRVKHGKDRPLDRLEIALQKLVVVASGVRDWCQKQFPTE